MTTKLGDAIFMTNRYLQFSEYWSR